MNTNNLVAEVTEIISKEAPMNSGYEAVGVTTVFAKEKKPLTFKETLEQFNDEWYVKHRGINYNFGAAGINVIGEEAE